MLFRRLVCVCAALPWLLASSALAAGPRVLPEGQVPADQRLGPPKDLNGYFPFQPPATVEAWNARVDEVRRQTLVSLGLWPVPERTPPRAVVHTPLDKGDYIVEHVYLESFPGHFVTGNLYRPKHAKGPLPGVLCPHGHWNEGRFLDQGVDEVRQQIVNGAERFENGGRSPLQARCMQLARMGCVVFHYDMVGYADSRQVSFEVAHRYSARRPEMESDTRWGYFSPQAELRLEHIMGLQTYNSLRALDWMCERADVDPRRIGVTGASGGGTQTFILCAIDPRPTAAFPAVMVSTGMQGGCTCENCDYLRVNTGNIELAGLFAPRPLGMSGANDWTVEIATKGLPELKQLYQLLGAPDNVMARPLNHFGHNYNYVSRAAMYSWFNTHLKLGHAEPIVEEDFPRLSREELTVWNDQHPAPATGDQVERELLATITAAAEKQLAALTPHDATTLAEYRRVIGGAFEVLVGRGLPAAKDLEFERRDEVDRDTYLEFSGLLRNQPAREESPVVFLQPKRWNKQVVIWADAQGKAGLYSEDGSPTAAAQALLDSGAAVAGLDLLYQGEFLPDGQAPARAKLVETERQFAGFTYGYNHPLFAQRVHDLLNLIVFVRNHPDQPERIHLVGLNQAGPWVAAALVVAGDTIDRAVIDTHRFRFAQLKDFADVNFLPGSVKYGDLPGMLSLAAPHALLLAGEPEIPEVVRATYRAAGAPQGVSLLTADPAEEAAASVAWLLK